MPKKRKKALKKQLEPVNESCLDVIEDDDDFMGIVAAPKRNLEDGLDMHELSRNDISYMQEETDKSLRKKHKKDKKDKKDKKKKKADLSVMSA